MQHEFRSDFLVEFLWRQEAQSDGSLLQRGAFLMSLFGTLRHVCEIREMGYSIEEIQHVLS